LIANRVETGGPVNKQKYLRNIFVIICGGGADLAHRVRENPTLFIGAETPDCRDQAKAGPDLAQPSPCYRSGAEIARNKKGGDHPPFCFTRTGEAISS